MSLRRSALTRRCSRWPAPSARPLAAAPELHPRRAAVPRLRARPDPRSCASCGARGSRSRGLGTALALRPRRRGTPPRAPAVVQTQIVLAIVGAVVMLVVGASLARAFGIVGVASLIRYRSKIDDPKDAVVMLCGARRSAWPPGSASTRSPSFATAVPRRRAGGDRELRAADAHLRAVGQARRPDRRPCARRSRPCCAASRSTTSCAASSEEEVSYIVTAPRELHTDAASKALTALVADGKGAVEWKEKSEDKSK